MQEQLWKSSWDTVVIIHTTYYLLSKCWRKWQDFILISKYFPLVLLLSLDTKIGFSYYKTENLAWQWRWEKVNNQMWTQTECHLYIQQQQ